MTIVRHELKRGRTSLIVWTCAICFLLGVSVMLFPQMKSEMDEVGDLFASMGSFTAAFGMDKLNFGTFSGYYAVECGNVLGLGGAFFAALLGISALCKEEKDRTAEFLLTHPVKRTRIVTEKLIAVLIALLILNAAVLLVSLAATAAIGESIPWKEILLLHLAYFILQLEIACVCFGVSAFLRRGGVGIGIGAAAILYFLNILSNITESAGFLKYLTPFGYCEGSYVIANSALDWPKVAIGLGIAALGVLAAYLKYPRKDIR
jgi:ABC-2 type transport system permease protein